MKTNKHHGAFTYLELLVIVFVLAIIALIFLPALTSAPPRADRIKCVNNLKNVGLAVRIFATDNNDHYPGAILLTNSTSPAQVDIVRVYQMLSNELSTPQILICPKDRKRQPANSFANLRRTNLSFFMSLSAKETNALTFLAGDRNLQTGNRPIPPGVFALTSNSPVSFSAELHNDSGNITMSDGSVQQFTSARLKEAIPNQDASTNYLLIP
jgi:type II secretory pathway pseudopilin PulG